jgi:hypothetical protein
VKKKIAIIKNTVDSKGKESLKGIKEHPGDEWHLLNACHP